MGYPSKFSLVGKKWLVRRVTSKQLARHMLDNDLVLDRDNSLHEAKGLLGLCDEMKHRIFINTDAHKSPEEERSTFWHEFAHALQYANGKRDHCEEETERLGKFLEQFDDTRNDKA